MPTAKSVWLAFVFHKVLINFVNNKKLIKNNIFNFSFNVSQIVKLAKLFQFIVNCIYININVMDPILVVQPNVPEVESYAFPHYQYYHI